MSNIEKTQPIHPLRQRMIEDMTLRGISETSQSGYICQCRVNTPHKCRSNFPQFGV